MKKKKAGKKSSQKGDLQIVKRKGHSEIYDERKVYASCFFACRNAHLGGEESEKICGKVSESITQWIKKKKIVSSNEIFKTVVQEIKKHNEDAAFLYETHRDLS